MPPKADPAKRKAAVFKPPRPVKDSAQATAGASKRVSGATASRPTGVTKKAALSRAPQVINSSDSEDDDLFSNADLDELMEDLPAPEEAPALAQSTAEAIPETLLARLLQEGFEDENTKIHRGAMELTKRYMDLFVKEAISRAVMERQDASKRGGAGGFSEGFLQVEDLEKLTPQLVLDF